MSKKQRDRYKSEKFSKELKRKKKKEQKFENKLKKKENSNQEEIPPTGSSSGPP